MSFQFLNNPVKFDCNNHIITMEAGPGTNLFNDICSDYRGDYFPFYYVMQKGEFCYKMQNCIS